jgi:hypothetical protein
VVSDARKPGEDAATPTPTTDPRADQDGATRRQRDEATGENPPGHEPPNQRLKRPD